MKEIESLSKRAAAVQAALNAKGYQLEVMELPQSTRTALEAAAAIGCEVTQIVKSLLFRIENTADPILILASGKNQVNERVIELLIGTPIVKADADFVKKITGFTIGGIPPIGHQTELDKIFIDEDLLRYESIWAAAGTPHAVFKLNAEDLPNLTAGKVVCIK